jgi:hypothetical protein
LNKDCVTATLQEAQHLKVLESAMLVSVEPLGNRHLCLIRREGMEDLRHYLDGFWSDVSSA